MLALHRRVVADDDVALVQIFPAVDFQTVFHRHAHRVGDEHRHAAGGLRKQFARGADESDGIVLVLVDIRAERRARHVGVDLVADRK